MFSKFRRLPASLLVQPRLPHSRQLRYAIEWYRMTLTHTTPLAKSISAVLLDIDALSSPSASSDIVTTEPLEIASPLTERALRYQRRDALRAAQDVVALISPHRTVSSNAILQNIVPAKFPELYRSNLTFTPQRNAPVLGKLHEYSMAATLPRVTKTQLS